MEDGPQGRLADPKAVTLLKALDKFKQGNVGLCIYQANDERLVRIEPRALKKA